MAAQRGDDLEAVFVADDARNEEPDLPADAFFIIGGQPSLATALIHRFLSAPQNAGRSQ